MLTHLFFISRSLIEASAKLSFMHRLLQKLKAGGHRVLIFSQSTRMFPFAQHNRP